MKRVLLCCLFLLAVACKKEKSVEVARPQSSFNAARFFGQWKIVSVSAHQQNGKPTDEETREKIQQNLVTQGAGILFSADTLALLEGANFKRLTVCAMEIDSAIGVFTGVPMGKGPTVVVQPQDLKNDTLRADVTIFTPEKISLAGEMVMVPVK